MKIKTIVWIVIIILILLGLFFIFKSPSVEKEKSSSAGGLEGLSAEESAEIPSAGEDLIDNSVLDENDEIDLGDVV
jgi:hypothetical protein